LTDIESDQILAQARAVVERLGLEVLGYDVQCSHDQKHLRVRLSNRLLPIYNFDISVGLADADWPDRLGRELVSDEDLALYRAAGSIRPDAVPIIAALRGGAIQGRVAKYQNEAKTEGALWAISSAMLYLVHVGLLTEAERDWIMQALVVDQGRQ
jgi:hypothetical protein